MTAKWIWGAAFAVYAVFLAWHENWRGPLSPAEIDRHMAQLEQNAGFTDAQRALVLDFMRADSGKEFFMVNLMAFPPGTVTHPESGQEMTPQELLSDYTRPFLGKLFLRAGYPAFTGPLMAGYLDAWNVEANPGWTATGLIRYRSRRDMIEAATDAGFNDSHIYKQLALRATLAVPSETGRGLLMTPRVWLALWLVALAALAHLAMLQFVGRKEK